MRFSTAAVMLAATTAVLTAQPAATDLLVIIDTDSPVAQSDRAEQLRDIALAGFAARPRLASLQLTERGVSPIPSLQADTLSALHFEQSRRLYSGVSMTITEAAEILRGNEPVRDEVVRRTCAERPGCAALVRAAAVAFVDDIDTVAARKMRALGETARFARAKTIILLTAGWPSRQGRVRVDDAMRDLAAAGSSLVVWKLPSSVAYGSLVSDAVDVLATRVRATRVVISDERVAEEARAAYADAHAVASDTPAPSIDAPAPAPPVPLPTPAPADDAFGAAGLADATLQRAAGYVESFERTFAAVMWRERYQQEAHTQTRFSSSGGRFTLPTGRRVLESELLLVWLPADASWLAVRDVVAVDGVARADADRQVSRALDGTPISVAQLKQLASENGRYNIGRILRTFNEPTFALLLLDSQHRHRFAFRRAKRESVGGRRAVSYEFLERARPTLIKDQTRDVPARGTLWIDESSGQILQTTLDLEQNEEGLRGTMTVRYAAHPDFDVLVPVEMRETYLSTAGEEVTTVASYSNFRRFQTAGRIIIPQ